MGRLGHEARTAMAVLLKQGHSQSAVARLLGVTEGAVRYQRRRQESGAVDGRSRQTSAVAAHAAAIAHWREQQTGGRINLAALHDWLRREHGYAGSLKGTSKNAAARAVLGQREHRMTAERRVGGDRRRFSVVFARSIAVRTHVFRHRLAHVGPRAAARPSSCTARRML